MFAVVLCAGRPPDEQRERSPPVAVIMHLTLCPETMDAHCAA